MIKMQFYFESVKSKETSKNRFRIFRNISSDLTKCFLTYSRFLFHIILIIIYKLDIDLQIFVQFRIVSQIFSDR